MPTIKVIKRGGFPYGVGPARKQYGLGKELVAKQKDARYLVAAKLAEYVDAAPAAKPKVAAKPKAATRTTRTTKTTAAKRSYNRRDMKAK